MGAEIESEIKGKVSYQKKDTLEGTLKFLRENFSADKGVLLFSPAFPSFDQFQNYAQRGETFVKLLGTPS